MSNYKWAAMPAGWFVKPKWLISARPAAHIKNAECLELVVCCRFVDGVSWDISAVSMRHAERQLVSEAADQSLDADHQEGAQIPVAWTDIGAA